MTQTIPATKAARQALIRRIIETEAVRSQGELALRLVQQGIHVTQATLSRDLVDIGAIKVRGLGGAHVYATSDSLTASEDTDQRLTRLCGELLLAADGSANLAVIRTPSGAAQYLASAIDQHEDIEILGCVGGDDTIMVISRDPDGGLRLAQRFLERAAGGGHS
ncbi:arginine repressor [Demequina sp. NBRC 110051]|uniref:arginine repressor n=1 Tax=Demequina sp. NBRC 110051 TaxID=1570340 RepID=UPI000A009731|nr:arginine repressor [Demequina sp. NBRC 110051]